MTTIPEIKAKASTPVRPTNRAAWARDLFERMHRANLERRAAEEKAKAGAA